MTSLQATKQSESLRANHDPRAGPTEPQELNTFAVIYEP